MRFEAAEGERSRVAGMVSRVGAGWSGPTRDFRSDGGAERGEGLGGTFDLLGEDAASSFATFIPAAVASSSSERNLARAGAAAGTLRRGGAVDRHD